MQAPHRAIKIKNASDRFLVGLFDSLWERYRGRVSYVRRYEDIVEKNGAVFLNDHVAFRTLAAQKPSVGLSSIGRLFEALGYQPAGAYSFVDKHLSAVHFRHPNPGFPKVFISELKTWEFPAAARRILERSLKTHRNPLPDTLLAELASLEKLSASRRKAHLRTLTGFFSGLPWKVPQRSDVEDLNRHTQYGAWVLVNGYDVNHFTASVDAHGKAALKDIEKTVAAMSAAGIPMKKTIEGARGSKLRQSSTESVVTNVRVRQGGRIARMPWTYAYFELAERPRIKNPVTGRLERFEGFLGPQATNLFEMTRLR